MTEPKSESRADVQFLRTPSEEFEGETNFGPKIFNVLLLNTSPSQVRDRPHPGLSIPKANIRETDGLTFCKEKMGC
jgi:hypothetical protein